MKTTLLLILLLGIVSLSSTEPVADFTLPNIQDRPVSLYDYIGEQIVILDFWASWCVPCTRLLPELDKINKEYEDVTVIAVSIDNPRDVNRAKNIIRSQNYSVTALFDTNREIAERFKVRTVPHTFVFDYGGNLIFEHTGYARGDEQQIIAAIDQYRKSLDSEEE